MINLGIISAATYGASYRGDKVPRKPGSNHGTAFATAFNGYDEAKAAQWEWTFVKSPRRIEGARIVKIWDPHRQWAERLAEATFIEQVCDSPEQCCEDVDAVLIVDDGSGDQCQYAFHPLREGVPTYCDKPLAMTARRAKEVATAVRETGTPFMSASSLRFPPDIVALGDRWQELGRVNLATVICGNELVYYGIHALSMYYGVFRGDSPAVSCMNVGTADVNIVRVLFENGRQLLLMVGEGSHMRGGYQINLYGKNGWETMVPGLDGLYCHLLERFIRQLETGEEAVPVEQEVEVIAVLEAGKRSLVEAREISVAEVLE